MTDREKAFWIIGESKGDEIELAKGIFLLKVPLDVILVCLQESNVMLKDLGQSVSSSTETNR